MTEESLRAKLAADIHVTDWGELRSHAVAGRAFLVARDFELLEVALAVANDETAEVSAWIETGKLTRPSLAQMKAFERSGESEFRYVIVSPFVLVQTRFAEGTSAAASEDIVTSEGEPAAD